MTAAGGRIARSDGLRRLTRPLINYPAVTGLRPEISSGLWLKKKGLAQFLVQPGNIFP